jgi:DNA-binding XRE family transcriptional regulator
MGNRAAPNYKKSHPLVITLRMSLHPDRTLGERIKKWRLEQGLFQKDLAKIIGVDEMTIVNWEKGKTMPDKKNLEWLQKLLRIEPPIH